MNEELKEKIMETVCGLCWYPCIACSQDWLDEKCEDCPMEKLLNEVQP
jgi:hypothetical protein